MNRQKKIDMFVISVFVILSILAGSQIFKIRVDSSTDVFIPQKHEINEINQTIEDEFGVVDAVLMGIQVNFGSVLEPEVLNIIDDITTELESLDYVDDVLSLTNMDYIMGTEEGMKVVPLIYDLSDSEIESLKRRIVDWSEVYEGSFISKDKKLSAIIIQTVTGSDESTGTQLYEVIKNLSNRYKSANITFPVAGLPVINEEISRSIVSDLFWLIPVASILILLILFVSFKRWEGVIFPMIGLLIANILVMGIIGFLQVTFTMSTTLVPVLLLVVGSAYGIHVMSHFYEELKHCTGYISYSQITEISKKCVSTIFIPVLLAGLTTAGGFVSLVSSPLGPFRAFGVLSAVGVFCSQFSSLVLIPVLIRLRYSKGLDVDRFHKHKDIEDRTKTTKIVVLVEKVFLKRGWTVILLSLIFFAVTIGLLPRINVGTDTVKFFKPESSVVKDIKVFDEKLSGSNIVSVMISAPNPGDILDPDFLSTLESFETYLLENTSSVNRVQSIVPSIKRINKLMNQNTIPYASVEEEVSFDFFGDESFSLGEGEDGGDTEEVHIEEVVQDDLTYGHIAEMLVDSYLQAGSDITVREFLSSFLTLENFQGEAFNEIPQIPEKYGFNTKEELKNLISQYLVLYSGNLNSVINDSLEPDKTHITIQLNDVTTKSQRVLMDNINTFWEYHLLDGWDYSIGGGATLSYVLSGLVSHSQVVSMLAALLVVALIVAMMFRSPIAGFIGLIPVLFALAGIFLFIVIFNFNLDIVTSLLASLAIGIGVDYAIHIMDAYKRNMSKGIDDCLFIVYKTTGKAVLINAASVVVGFMSLVVSQFIPIRQMGILFAVSMVFACGASLIVLPIILNKLKPKFLQPKMIEER